MIANASEVFWNDDLNVFKLTFSIKFSAIELCGNDG